MTTANRNRRHRAAALSAVSLGFGLSMPGLAFHGRDGATGVKDLRDEFSRLHTEATKIVDDAIAAGAELTAEVKAENDKRFARMEAIKGLLDQQAKFAKLALETGGVGLQEPVKHPGQAAVEEAVEKTFDRKNFARAAMVWAATGIMAAQFATVTTASQSGILLPVAVAAPLTPSAPNVFRAAHALYGLTPMQTTTTNKINIPVLSATAGGAVAETDSAENENVPGLTESIVSTPGTYESGSVYFSNLSLLANDIDIIAYVENTLYYSKELGLESAAVAAIIADAGITQVVDTATTTSITAANLTSLNNALPKRFNAQKVILLSATAYSAADALYQSGTKVLVTGADGVKRFDGTPVLRSDYFEALTADNVVGGIVSLMGFHLRDAGQAGVTRYTQVPAKPNQTGFNLFAYHAYGYCPSAIAKLHTPAS